ncbi:hypothetical protein BDZ88DRAFT_416094 [Geranomyces variabilis]|nr:hypothetical protein BDZ88DRAFT_416094 [Geranomyces variabilis]
MTIVHVILFKVKPTAEQEAFVTNVKTLATLPGVHNFSIGPTFTKERANGYTHAMVMEFESKEALNAYSVSDAHQQVIKTHIAPNIEPGSTMCLDYEK